ncbi:hypothetical protein BJ165DRAFT_1528826 [Panaeolus papilionaceus]|nr:hypothetical protein BJ165DRAFT_1528826 [Panaeolus papilionaceus]
MLACGITSAPPPLLFDPDLFEEKTGQKAHRDDNGHHTIGVFKFESGLLCRSVAPHEFQVNPVSLPLNMFLMFRRSGHRLAFSHAHPKPNEWCINKNSRVRVTSEPVMCGTVAALSARHLEVQGDEGIGLVCVLWGDVLKDFIESDFVKVVAGPCAGRSGWILAIVDAEATLLDESTVSWETAEEMQVHLNCLRSTVPDVGRTSTSQPKRLIHASNHHPWLNMDVIVIKPGCPWQTKDIWLVSSDVVEKSTGLLLWEYFSRTHQPAAAPNPMTADVKDISAGNATPPWNPKAIAAPLWLPLPSLSTSLHAAIPPALSHPLLNRHLLNVPLKVKLTGGSFNGMDVVTSLKDISGTLGLFYIAQNKNTPIQPSWVTLRHPNPRRDNGLLVVVEGEHCGRFVHWIRHVDWTGVGMIIIVALMEHVAGQQDKIAGELEFKPNIRKRAQKEF